ncbi:MAG TPA: class I mannose-6-phosphate isomerase, partial [Clostridia bacterium]|nr:class I mannose-6-phosphate isomerase [Clostridia bacterium]
MNPFKMTPAYRCGASTPWGGEALREVFGKQIPDSRTGESLEVSALPGLCSRDEDGTPLDALLERHGAALRGTAIGERFPLLLKLLDARDRLSVQVHPNDAYAAAHEQGKLGKTEAWVILAAEPGAQLIYGLNPSVDRETLRQSLGNPEALEACLNRVYVQPGEVFYIPAGMVHAIGGGILLYEIQQSSDVTYRLWDWMRRDAKGNLRELHVEDALAVTRTGLWMESLAGVTIAQGRSSRTLYIA